MTAQVHSNGLLELRLARRGVRTYVKERRQRFPLRFTVPLYLDPRAPGMAYLYVQNPTGGVFAGDRLVTGITAEPGVQAHLTTQSATKVYRMTEGEARQQLTVRLAEGSYVEYLPDQLIPQAGSVLHQRTYVDVGRDAVYLGSELVAPGRLARDERFAYDGFSTRTEVTRAGEMLCVDAMELAPSRCDPRAAGMLADGGYLASLLAVAPDADADQLTERLDALLAADETVVGAAGALPNRAGAYARVVAPTARTARVALTRLVSAAREATLGLPLPEVRK